MHSLESRQKVSLKGKGESDREEGHCESGTNEGEGRSDVDEGEGESGTNEGEGESGTNEGKGRRDMDEGEGRSDVDVDQREKTQKLYTCTQNRIDYTSHIGIPYNLPSTRNFLGLIQDTTGSNLDELSFLYTQWITKNGNEVC